MWLNLRCQTRPIMKISDWNRDTTPYIIMKISDLQYWHSLICIFLLRISVDILAKFPRVFNLNLYSIDRNRYLRCCLSYLILVYIFFNQSLACWIKEFIKFIWIAGCSITGLLPPIRAFWFQELDEHGSLYKCMF